VQWVTSAHYLLSDLYITDEVDDFETSSNQSTEDSDDQTEQVAKLSVTRPKLDFCVTFELFFSAVMCI